jgi:hypothetical protein
LYCRVERRLFDRERGIFVRYQNPLRASFKHSALAYFGVRGVVVIAVSCYKTFHFLSI